MTENEYLRLRGEVEKQCRQDLDALERVWRMVNRLGPNAPAPRIAPSVRRGRVDMLTRWVIAKLTEQDASAEFGVRDIQGRISTDYPEDARTIRRASISSALLRLAAANQLDVVVKGSGRRESVYRRSVPSPEEHDPYFERST